MAEQSKMGSNVKESFAQMDEGGNVEDQVGVQIHQLNPIKMKNISEKLTSWQSKSLIKEGFEDDHLTSAGGREEFPVGSAPSDEGLLRKDLIGDHLLEVLLRHSGLHPYLLGMWD